MTPKDKAKELVDKMWNIDERYGSIGFHEAKQCALICLEELFVNNTKESKHNYWIDVKEEIEKL